VRPLECHAQSGRSAIGTSEIDRRGPANIDALANHGARAVFGDLEQLRI
jgi:hypothetical protein